MHLKSEFIFEQRMHMPGIADRSLTMLFKYELTNPSFGGYRNG